MGYPIGGYDQKWSWEDTSYTLLSGYLPHEGCGIPPVGCYLEITGYTTTDVIIRGDDDGQIVVGISGASGTTTWYLNGEIYYTGTATSVTFTGLTAGSYDVTITDSHTPDSCVASLNDIIILDGEFRTGDFIVQSPTGLTAVENPIIVSVNTAVINPKPVPNILTLAVVGTVPNNFSLTFNLTSPYEYSQKFYAKAYPNKPNYFLASVLNNQYGTPAGNNTATEIATSLAESLQNDVLIPKIYYINNSNNVVTLWAKETGSKFNLSSANVIASSGAITVTQTQAGTDYCDGQMTDNYSISCEVMANTDMTNQYPDTGQDSDFNRIAELTLPFNPTNIHKFDISSILKSQVNTPIPDINLTGSTLLPTVMQPYYVRISELYPLVANTNTIKKRYKTDTNVQWVINSSLDKYNANNMDDYLGNPLTNLNPNYNYTLATGYIATFNNYLLNTEDTGTTNIMFSIWDSTDTTMLKSWQTGNTFVSLSSGSYYGKVSGKTDGSVYTYKRSFFVSQYSFGQDSNKYPTANHEVKFLTNSPNPKQIQRNSNEFLYFILPRDYGVDLTMRGDLYFYDGTSATGQTFFTIATGGINAGGCMIMNLSYDKLGLENYEVSGATNRKIKRAELAVWQDDGTNPATPYTEIKTYRFEIDEMPRKFGVLFQNALGMYDAFDFIGMTEETINRNVDSYTVPLNYNINGSISAGQKNIATYNTKITKKIKCNTGWIDEDHFDWLMEMLKSNNIYSTSITTQNYLNLTDFTYKKSSLEDLFDIECTFMWTIIENNVTI